MTSLHQIDRITMRSAWQAQLFLRRSTETGQLIIVMMKRRGVVVETRWERGLSIGIWWRTQVIETVVILENIFCNLKKVRKICCRFFYLLLLLWWALMCWRMVEWWWKVRRLEIRGLMHARAVLTWRQSTRPSTATCCMPWICWAATRQADTATVTRQPLLWKRKLFENFLMNQWGKLKLKVRVKSRKSTWTSITEDMST